MNRAIIMKDRRLIEALDYIDDEYIASAALYKMRAYAESTRPLAQTAGQSVKKHWKHYLGFVACILVLALATPLFTHLPEIINSFASAGGTEDETTNGMYDEYILTEEDLAELNEAYFKRKIESDPEIYADMSEDELNELRESKYSKFATTIDMAMSRSVDPGFTFYFGKYGDCIVVSINGMIPVGFSFELCGYTLGNSYTTILACYDSTLYYIPEAYEMGLLSDYDIQKMYEIYSEYYTGIPVELNVVPPSASNPSPIDLDGFDRRIVWDYIKDWENDDKLDHSYSVRCYGMFDPVCAVMIDISGTYYTDNVWTETVNGIEFVYHNGQRLQIYSPLHGFLTLGDAFDEGIIHEEFLLSIIWHKRAAFTYSDVSAPIALNKYEIEDILRAYVDIHHVPGDKDLDYSLRCYGEFHENGKHIYVVSAEQTGKTYDSKLTREEVNGLVFEYPTDQTLLVYPYDKHEFHTITEAFESGLLTAEELKEVYDTYTANN